MSTRSRELGTLLTEAVAGDRGALARLLSLVERGGPLSRELARLVYATPPPHTVGLTGAPGAGKSTLTSRLIAAARGGWTAGPDDSRPVDQVAVLAVDPSSPLTGGAILGDRVRMQDHATDPSVYIRSMATRGHLGGLALAVPEAVRVLGAVGMPLVIVETVGVGQMELDVAAAADTTVVVVTPGWGDAMQANKAGLLEVADVFVVNKADRPGVREARRDLEQMLDLSAHRPWRPPIVETVAASGQGIDALWVEIGRHRDHLSTSGELAGRRRARVGQELRRVVTAQLLRRAEELTTGEGFADAVAAVGEGRLDPYEAVGRLMAGEPTPATPSGPGPARGGAGTT
ncbi:MAG: methylmalonyl Co-A mutase-associated GTPase MeaB [Acidimicrobiales bacterium]